MLAKDYLGYFYHHHNNDKCLFIDRIINHSDLTLRPIIDLVLEKKPECIIYNYTTLNDYYSNRCIKKYKKIENK